MARAHGRKGTGRPVEVTPEEARELGLSVLQSPEGSPIPGLTGNVKNYETHRQVPATGDEDLPEFRGMMAHGVQPEDHTAHDRAAHERGEHARAKPLKLETPAAPVVPVPVYLVEGQGGGRTYRESAPRHVTVANSASDATRLCGKNPKRIKIGLLNEDTATNVRFAQRITDLTNGGGALLPWPVNSYQWFETQGELYASTVSTTLTVTVSIIEEWEAEL
jgi:hypothetical protein